MASAIITGEVGRPHFDPKLHRYTFAGRAVPSVTQIMRPLTDAAYRSIAPDVLANAAEFGTAVHAATEYWDEGELDESVLEPDWVPYLEAYKLWQRHTRPSVLQIEDRLACAKFAGTIDRIVRFDADQDETLWVVDLKTTSVLHPHVGVQLAAYVALASKMYPGHKWRRAALQLKGDGSYVFREYKDFSDETCFVALLGIHYWGKQHAG